MSPEQPAIAIALGNKLNANTLAKDNALVRALARWEGEGGGLDTNWEKRASLSQEEEHILDCLGAAVIVCWSKLSAKVQRELFEGAASFSDPLPTAELKKQIARFLHNHKNVY